VVQRREIVADEPAEQSEQAPISVLGATSFPS